MAWKPEVKVQGEWSSNALVFATEGEAVAYARDLYSRWTMTEDHRAVACEGEATHAWSDETGLESFATGTKRFPARSVSL